MVPTQLNLFRIYYICSFRIASHGVCSLTALLMCLFNSYNISQLKSFKCLQYRGYFGYLVLLAPSPSILYIDFALNHNKQISSSALIRTRHLDSPGFQVRSAMTHNLQRTRFTHTHTHTHIYIYIYIYDPCRASKLLY